MSRSAVPPPVTAVIDAAGAWLPGRMEEVERELDRVTDGEEGPLASAAAATLAAGGKRLRPLLVQVFAGESAGAAGVPAAVAVELVHMATLVHDDVLDAAATRRGQPTVVAQSGRERATAVGDFLLARAFAELARDGTERQVQILVGASVSLALGELAQRRDAYDTSISEERYLKRCELKTARLFEAACVLGRVAAEEPGADELGRFGGEIGLAFQLLDDVLDVAGLPERTGKARGTDLIDGTVTLPLILAARRDPELAAVELRGLDATDAERICDRIAATGVLEGVRDRARAGVDRARAALESDHFSSAERLHLGLVATGVVERYS